MKLNSTFQSVELTREEAELFMLFLARTPIHLVPMAAWEDAVKTDPLHSNRYTTLRFNEVEDLADRLYMELGEILDAV